MLAKDFRKAKVRLVGKVINLDLIVSQAKSVIKKSLEARRAQKAVSKYIRSK